MQTTKHATDSRADSFDRFGFWALIVTQFQGAFIDNVYKLIIMLYLPLLVTDPNFPSTAASTAVFNLPWLLFPGIAGALADRFSKRSVTIATKIWEMGVVLSGVFAVILGNPYMLLGTLFMIATQSTFFSPAKYGLLPETLPESRLSWGNGQLNMWTFLAIILGNAAGGYLLYWFKSQLWVAMLMMLALSVVGVVTAFYVTPAPPAQPTRNIPLNPYSGMGQYLRLFIKDRRLLLTMVGIAFFWFAGALVIQTVIEHGKATLHNEALEGLMLTVMALGIGIGSLIAGYFSRGTIEVGLVPLGLAGLGATSVLLGIPGLSYGVMLLILFALGFFGGLYDVPLAATLQQRSPDKIKGGMISTSNFVTFAAMMVASGLFWLFFNLMHMTPQHVFIMTGLLAFAVLVYTCLGEPIFVLRMVLWILNTSLYKTHVQGRHHLPEKGGVLLVGNHISLLDSLAILASTGHDIHFVMGKEVYDTPWSRRIARMMDIIAIDPKAPVEEVEARIRQSLTEGNIVCINNEPRYSAEGAPVPWHNDYARLVEGMNVPIIPLYLTRLWESLYTLEDGKARFRWPNKLRFPIAVLYGEPLPLQTPATELRKAINMLGMDWYYSRKHRFQALHRGFIKTARHHLRTTAVADALSGQLSYFSTLVGSIIFARKLKTILGKEPMVGVLVPPSVGGVLTNIALQMLGRVPVNLNYTASAETMAACANRCGIAQVLTSKRFLERLPLKVPGETVFLEDIKDSVTSKDRIIGMLFALLAPVRLIEHHLGAPRVTENDLATVIFSSGSEGEPKGVMLTQRNILSQIDVMGEIFPHNAETRIMGYLPFFHSFGFTGTLWMPILHGLAGVYHANPLEPKPIGELMQKYKCSIMIGTSTFLQGFIRRCTPEQFQYLKFVVCGAEKLSPRVRNAFKEKFNVEPLEGYGTTECAPVVSLNLPDAASPGFLASRLIHGTIGKPVPGVNARVVNADSGEILPTDESGLLQIKGPNIMRGYMDMPEKTASVLNDGWYSTGDIASIDGDGFITITDRLARFSKIGGEMVPHTKLEEILHGLLNLTDQSLAVAGVPDAVKGERLVVLHTLDDAQLEELISKLDGVGLPNLWRPRSNSFYRIEALPVLGTGKLDIKSVKKMALAMDHSE